MLINPITLVLLIWLIVMVKTGRKSAGWAKLYQVIGVIAIVLSAVSIPSSENNISLFSNLVNLAVGIVFLGMAGRIKPLPKQEGTSQ